MRQPDWRLWLLRDRPRELAQTLFLLHPEWEEFATLTEIGNLRLRVPWGEEAILIECYDDGAVLTIAGTTRRLEDREAMRTIEALLAEEHDSRMRG